MLYLVTGQPGNGKTLRAMALMVEEYERNAAAVKAGKEQPRRFFSNIKGSYKGDPEAPNPDAFDWIEPMPEHRDWTLLPEGSFVVYDEAHADGKTRGLERYGHLFPATGKPGESDDPRIRAMSTHRHGGYDLVLVTQYPNKVHHQVRKLVGTHIHMTRAMGLSAAGMMTWARCQEDPYDERQREKAEEEIWQFPKGLYSRYVSATLHTAGHKFRVPKKVKNGLITGATMVLMLAGFWWFMGWDLSTFTGGGEQPQAKASVASPAAAPSVFNPSTFEDSAPALAQGMGTFIALQTEPTPTLMGCVSSDRGCRCFNSDGFQIDMAQTQCEDVLSKPLPFNVAHKYARAPRDDSLHGVGGQRDSDPGPVQPVPGHSGGHTGTAPAPAVDGTFGTITRVHGHAG